MSRRDSILLFTLIGALAVGGLVIWKSCRNPKGQVDRPRSSHRDERESDRTQDESRPAVRLRPGPSRSNRSSLRTWIERVGRAVILKDRRSYAKLRASAPDFYESDVSWLLELLRADLFTAAGAAHMISSFGLRSAVPELERMLYGGAHLAAKDVAVDSLAELGGDAASAALIKALRSGLDASIRARAARALGRFRGPEVYRALVEVLHARHLSAVVRQAAAEALRDLPSKDLIHELFSLIAGEPQADVVAELAVTIYRSGGKEILPRLRETLAAREDAQARLNSWIKQQPDVVFSASFARDFFRPGGSPISREPGHRRIGITVHPGEHNLIHALQPLLQAAPLDRYRDFFYLRIEAEFLQDLQDGLARPRAYDLEGRPIPDGVPRNELDGTVFLRFVDAKEFAPGILGFTEGAKANVTPTSLLHEFGHAFANLADEYDHPLASNGGGGNVDLPGGEPKWQGLIRQGHLGSPSPRGDRLIPSENCHMGNRRSDERFCPVCQLVILARLCELSGAPVPW